MTFSCSAANVPKLELEPELSATSDSEQVYVDYNNTCFVVILAYVLVPFGFVFFFFIFFTFVKLSVFFKMWQKIFLACLLVSSF